jgi:hypothetical protein
MSLGPVPSTLSGLGQGRRVAFGLVSRPTQSQTLGQLRGLGLLERQCGHGWPTCHPASVLRKRQGSGDYPQPSSRTDIAGSEALRAHSFQEP